MSLNYIRTAFLLCFLTLIFVSVGFVIGGQGGMLLAFVFALGMNLFSLWKSGDLVLRMHKAQVVDETSGGQLYALVRELSARAGLPTPRVAIMQMSQPNAFATGRNPANATVCASTGLLDALTPEEVAGVMAHELAHIRNRDTLTMTLAASLGGAISMMGQYLQIGAIFGRGRAGPFGWIGFIVAGLIAPVAAMMVQMAISRSREYQADRVGSQICGNPLWLASALVKIQNIATRTRNPTAESHRSSAHMFIINPLAASGRDGLFATHPSVENRVAELERLAVEMGVRDRSGSISGGAIFGPTPWLPGRNGNQEPIS